MIPAVLGIAGLTLRTLFAGKRAWVSFVLLLLPPLIALVMAVSGRVTGGDDVFRQVTFTFTLHVMIFGLALPFGISLTSGEIEDGTACYVYLGAVPKWLIVLVQIGAAAAALAAVLLAGLALTALAAALAPGGPPRHPWRDVGVCTLVGGIGIALALSFYSACGLVFRRPLTVMAVATGSTFLWEFVATYLPARFAAYTVTNNLRVLLIPLLFEGRMGKPYRYVRNYELLDYGGATMYLSLLAGFLLCSVMVAVMNRSVEGRETR